MSPLHMLTRMNGLLALIEITLMALNGLCAPQEDR